MNGWQSIARSFAEGGVVATDDTVYTGFGFEGMNAAARPAFMKGVLNHLGVQTSIGPAGGGGGGGGGGTPPGGGVLGSKARATARVTSGRRLRADRKGRINVRVTCSGTAGATCKGIVRLKHGKTTYGSKSFTIRANKTFTLTVKLRKSAFRTLKRKGARSISVTIGGADSSGARISAKKSVKLLAPRKH